MSSTCIFCRIAAGDIPATIVDQDDHVVAFRDLNPVAPVHILIIPREHVASVNDVEESHADVIGRLFVMARSIADSQKFANDGYRVVMNTGRNAGQTVDHIHLHLLAGRTMTWPPG